MSVLDKVLSKFTKLPSRDGSISSFSRFGTTAADEGTATSSLPFQSLGQAPAAPDVPATPSDKVTSVLDASAYPHLVECIVKHASFEALLAIRLSSRRLRFLADECLPRHISFERDGTITVKRAHAGGRAIWTPGPFLPAVMRIVDVHIVDPNFRLEHFKPPTYFAKNRGTFGHEHIRRVLPRIHSLDVLRVRADTYTYEALIGMDLAPQTCVVVVDSEIPEMVPMHVPTRCWKLVICILHKAGEDPSPPAFCWAPDAPRIESDIPELSEVVVTYSQQDVHSDHLETTNEQAHSAREIRWHSVGFAVRCLSRRNGKATFVDTATWPPLALYKDGMTEGADVTDFLIEEVWHRLSFQFEFTEESCYEAFDNLSFSSFDQYRARVGQEQFALETCLDWAERTVVHGDEAQERTSSWID